MQPSRLVDPRSHLLPPHSPTSGGRSMGSLATPVPVQNQMPAIVTETAPGAEVDVSEAYCPWADANVVGSGTGEREGQTWHHGTPWHTIQDIVGVVLGWLDAWCIWLSYVFNISSLCYLNCVIPFGCSINSKVNQ